MMNKDYYQRYKHQQRQERKSEFKNWWSNVDHLKDYYKKYERTKHPLWKMLIGSERKKVIKSFLYGIPNSTMWSTESDITYYEDFQGSGFKEFLDYLYEETDYKEYKIKLRDKAIDQLL